ncbi:hypothetical protein Ahy_B02g057846 [Arachis hypogaea]|uniref:RING-type domain-containing protein n=1 Tax=Arachis hypogaea TaxID=3818 RepID=A0A445ACY8_ARAHY|nr:hypothetical protein Ahy_B02g057846 [Arachis hypogaea]
MALSIDGNNHNINNEDPKVKMVKPHKNGIELPFCGICCDFKPSWEMFETLKCGHNFCRFCMHEYVASCLKSNIIIVPCPDSKCKVKHGGMKCGMFMSLNKNEREKEDLMVMNFAKAKRWRRCSKCRIYVEKNEGCSYISCRFG